MVAELIADCNLEAMLAHHKLKVEKMYLLRHSKAMTMYRVYRLTMLAVVVP